MLTIDKIIMSLCCICIYNCNCKDGSSKDVAVYLMTVRQGSSSEECVINTKTNYFSTCSIHRVGTADRGKDGGGVQQHGL